MRGGGTGREGGREGHTRRTRVTVEEAVDEGMGPFEVLTSRGGTRRRRVAQKQNT